MRGFKVIEIVESIDREKWENFVSSHPEGNIFQTCAMADVYRSTKNYEPISLAAVEKESGEILAVLQAVIIREGEGIIGSFSGRSVITGGPLYIQQKVGYEASRMLLKHYNEVARKKAIYTQVRNMWNTKDIKHTIESAGYTYEDHLNYLLDLNQSSERIWQNIKKSRKGDIKNAEKNGIKITKIENLSGIKEFYGLIQETYKRSGLPLADISLFESAFNKLTPKSMVDFYLVIQNSNNVGSGVMLKYKNIIYNWYMGSKDEAKYVDGALIWHILKENAETEKIFDFGGAGHPEKPYGVRDFKRRFGGMEVNYGRYEKVHNTAKKEISKIGFKAYKKIGKIL